MVLRGLLEGPNEDAAAAVLEVLRVDGMTAPKRIQRQRTRGWRMPEGAVYVGRPTIWGNPWLVDEPVQVTKLGGDLAMVTMTPALAVACYRDLMDGRLAYQGLTHPEDRAYVDGWHEALARLRGRALACWCPLDQPCHADVLLELAKRPAPDTI